MIFHGYFEQFLFLYSTICCFGQEWQFKCESKFGIISAVFETATEGREHQRREHQQPDVQEEAGQDDHRPW